MLDKCLLMVLAHSNGLHAIPHQYSQKCGLKEGVDAGPEPTSHAKGMPACERQHTHIIHTDMAQMRKNESMRNQEKERERSMCERERENKR